MSADKHNELARHFVLKVAAETKSASEMMVVVESALAAAMLILQRQHGFKPAGAVEMVEVAVSQATERFAASQRS